MPTVCIVRGCGSVHVKGNRNIRFHKLPKDEELRKKWINISDTNKNIKHGFVCSRHFESTAFERNLKYELLGIPVPPTQRKFKHGAVPTLHLPNLEACTQTVSHSWTKAHTQMEVQQVHHGGASISSPEDVKDCAKHGPQGVLRTETKAIATQTSVCVSQPHVSDCAEHGPQGVLRTETEATVSLHVHSAVPDSCIAFGHSERSNKKSDASITFCQLPKDLCIRRNWLLAVQRDDCTPGKQARLCSKRFAPEDFGRTSVCYVRLQDGAVPSIWEAFPAHLQKKRNERKPPTSHPVCGPAPQEAAVSTPAVPENHLEINSSDLPTKGLLRRKLAETLLQLHVHRPKGTIKMANSSISVVKRPKAVKSVRSDSEEDQPEFVKEQDVEIKEEVKDDYLDGSNLEGQSFVAYPNDDFMEIKEEDLDEVDIKEEEVEDEIVDSSIQIKEPVVEKIIEEENKKLKHCTA